MICPRCNAEYVEGIVRCDECGTDLVEDLVDEPTPGGGESASVRDLLFGEQPGGGPFQGDDAPDDVPEDRMEVQMPGNPRSHAMRRVHVAQTLADAYIVRDVLESNGFACTIKGEHLVGIRGEVPIADSLPSVWVPESQAERAIRVVTDAQGGLSEAGDWICPNCEEEIEGQFTDCWQCGTARP
jgi:putative signal transducing protein